MAVAHKIMDHDVSDEARDRIGSQRLRDATFMVQRAARGQLEPSDAEMLAGIFLNATDRKIQVTADYLTAELRARGRSPHKASEIVRAVFG